MKQFQILLTIGLAVVLCCQVYAAEQSGPWARLGEVEKRRLIDCGVDSSALAELLALDQQAFDQDFDGGWRPVADQEGCQQAAADLIRIWRTQSANVESPGMLYWHEGQMHAWTGDRERAVNVFRKARSSSAEWNLYVDATIAFLQRDRAALESARNDLAELRPSAELMASRRRFLEENPDLEMPEGFVEQPMNLNVVDRLLSCFASDYGEAYAGSCDREHRGRD